MQKNLLISGALVFLSLVSCATTHTMPPQPTVSMRIESVPDHATIYWSSDESGPWEKWKAREDRHITPSLSEVPVGDTFWIRVAKKDYLDGVPEFVRTSGGMDVSLAFELEMRPEIYATIQREKGMLLSEGQWIDPAESGLVQYNGRWVDPSKEGLIPFEGRLVKPRDEGLVFHEGAWAPPAKRDGLLERPSEIPEELGTVAEGLAIIREKDLAAARQAAIDDALSNALKQRLGVHLKSSRVFESYMLKKYRIESEASGAVESYKILEEAGEGGIYWVKLRAVFRQDTIADKNLDSVRILVAGDEFFVTGEVMLASTLALQSATNAFAEAGFGLVRNPDASWNLRSEIFDSSVFEEYRGQAKAGGADLLVTLYAKSQHADTFGNLITYNTNMEGRVIKVHTGEIVAAKTINIRGDRKLTRPEAAEASLTEAGKAMSDYLIGQIVERYSRLISHSLFVRGVKSRGQADLIARELREIEGVKSVDLVEYSKGFAEIEVELTPEADEVFPESVNRMSGSRLEVTRSLQGETVARVE